MSDLPLQLSPALAARLAAAFDREGKLLRVLEELGPVADRDVAAVDIAGGPIIAGLDRLGARVHRVPLSAPLRIGLPDASVDAVISAWSGFRGVDPDEIEEVDRVLRPDGRQLAIHEYGRDDIARFVRTAPEAGSWDRRDGPFANAGFRIRVVHAFWTFDSLDEAVAFVRDAFGDAGVEVIAGLRRPRLSHNLAVYHRARSDRSG